MKKNIYWILTCFLSVVSCDKTNDPTAATTIKNEISVKVYNTKTWSSITNKMDTVVGATVNLISESGTATAVTNSKGIATFSEVKENTYYLVASKDGLSNLTNTSTVESKVIGNLIIGVYTSQTDIESSARYSNSAIGNPKIADVNCDGLINSNDKAQGNYLKFEYKYMDLNLDGVIDAKDIMNGSLVKADNQVDKVVYIGN